MNSEVGMRKIRKGAGRIMRSNLIFLVLVLVNQNFIGDEYDDEGVSYRAIAQRTKRLNLSLTSVICLLNSQSSK